MIDRSDYGNRFTFTGRELDPENGLMMYRTRYYHPGMGRFTTRDTIGVWGDVANSGNGVAYVSSRPVKYMDPYGLWTPTYGPGIPLGPSDIPWPNYPVGPHVPIAIPSKPIYEPVGPHDAHYPVRMRVRGKPVIGRSNLHTLAGLEKLHAYIIITCEDGSEHVIRGGPGNKPPQPVPNQATPLSPIPDLDWGPILPQSMPYGPGAPDWNEPGGWGTTVALPPGITSDHLIGLLNNGCCKLSNIQVPYYPLGPNSNTTIRELLEHLLNPPVPWRPIPIVVPSLPPSSYPGWLHPIPGIGINSM